MRIKTKNMAYEEVLKQPAYVHKKPIRQWAILRWLVGVLSNFDLWRLGFTYKTIGMEKLDKKQPCLILMNHSAFADMKIIGKLFMHRPYQIINTIDSMVGLGWILRPLGCIPTTKYLTDSILIRDMVYTVKTLKSSIVMYPEAGYSFDGTATAIPESLGKCIKLLQVPVVMVTSYGVFARDPLYNNLQIRKVKMSAKVEYVLSPEDIKEKTAQQINNVLAKQFSFDQFKWQQENNISIAENFRADYLNRVLYKCPNCKTEGRTIGKGIYLTCENCGKRYELTEYGFMKAVEGKTELAHIPDWYKWERECVRKELEDDSYLLDIPVDISMMVNDKCLYNVGEGRLIHDKKGFHLMGCDGKLEYHHTPELSYTLNADFYWYEIGDVICIGEKERQYYCFPKGMGGVVAKARLAAEELYKMVKIIAKEK